MYICQSQSPRSYPLPPLVCSLHLCLCFCLANMIIYTTFQMVLVVKNTPANAGDMRHRSNSWVREDPLEEGMAKYFCLENPMKKGAWQPTVHRVTKRRTRPKQLSTQHAYHFSRFHIHALIYNVCFSLSDLLHSDCF